MPVGEDKKLDQLNELKASLFTKSLKQARELFLHKDGEGVNHTILLFVRLPLVKERLVGQLEKQSHRSEARTLEEEVKVLVVSAIAFLWPPRVLVNTIALNYLLLLNVLLVWTELNDVRFLLCLRFLLAFYVQFLLNCNLFDFCNFLAL